MLVCRKLDSCYFQVVASPLYLEKYGIPKHPVDLKQHNCLVYGSSKEVNNWSFCMENNETIMLKAKGKLASNDGLLMVSAALEGMGIAFGPSFMFKQHLNLGTLSLLLPEYQLPTAISAIYPANRNLPRRVRVLIDFLNENLSI
jgi:DNA-binding transcriptional LysR family regulator